MDEQNRLRLARIAARHARRSAEAPTARPQPPEASLASAEEEFRAAFIRAREEVLRPAMSAVVEELALAGYRSRITPGGTQARPAIDLHVDLPDADSKDIVRFFPFLDPERGWQIVAELEMKGKPFELSRFERFEELRRDVLEHVIIDAIEQMFSAAESRASAGSDPSPPSEAQALPAPPVDAPRVAPEVAAGTGDVQAAVPELTLEQYASFRARLSVDGEDDPKAWKDFGVGSRTAKEALQASFAERFRMDPGAQARFVERVRHLTAGLREERGTEARGLPLLEAETPRVDPQVVAGAGRAAPSEGSLDETATVFELPTALRPKARDALPFQVGASSPMAEASPEAVPRLPATSNVGETVDVGVDWVELRATLPFAERSASTGSVAYPRMPLERYAAFCAELAVFPENSAAILAKYKVTGEPARMALVEEWHSRLGAHPATKAEWQKLFDDCCAGLRRSTR